MSKRLLRRASAALSLALILTVLAPCALAVPVAENMEISTFRGMSVGGQLSAADPTGGELTFILATVPCKGRVALREDGHFIYTPMEGRRGRDYFGYRVVDEEGGVSQEATVIIRLLKPEKTQRYADTAGLACEYAAHVLAERGLFTGACIAGHSVFEPERSVSKGDFLVLCMAAAGENALRGPVSTGFTDDADIEVWQKSYASAALLRGFEDGEGAFAASSLLSRSEAAVLLCRVFALSPVVEAASETQEAADKLAACGIWTAGADMAAPLTRADAAIMLERCLALREE